MNKCRLEDCEREALFCGDHLATPPADSERAALVERIEEWMLAFEASGIGARHEYEGSDVPKALVAIARRLLIESRSLLEERRPRGEESVSDFDLSTLDLAEEIDDSQPAALANAARALAASPADDAVREALRNLLAAIAEAESDYGSALPPDTGCVRCTVGTRSTGKLCARHGAERVLEGTR